MKPDLITVSIGLDELPLRLRLEAFPAGVVDAIARRWMCEIRPADEVEDAYTIRLKLDSRLRSRPPSPSRPIRPRSRTVGPCTEIRVPGARARLTTGRTAATLEVHPRLLDRVELMEAAVGLPLDQALALADASFLHGAAFRLEELSIVVLGGPGAGKSTVAAAALTAGGTVLTDDSLVLHAAATGRLAVRPLRRDLFLRQGTPPVLPEALRRRLRATGPAAEARWRLDRSDAASRFCTRLEPSVLWVLRRDRRLRSFRLRALSQAAALSSLLEANGSPHLLHPAFGTEQQRLLELWSRLAAGVRSFELRLGKALLVSPAEILNEVAARLRETSC